MNRAVSSIKNFIIKKILPKKSDLIWWGVFILAIPLIQLWQTRNLISKYQTAPAFTLRGIDGKVHSLSDYRGKPVVIYFFAPWCTVCKATSSNISYLRKLRDKDDLVVIAVGLSYSDQGEIKNFAKDHGFDHIVPVLPGDDSIGDKYRIDAFPTFYFIDAKGQVTSTSTGYTTTAGLVFRSL